jgi:hypothetical protein
LDYLYIDPSTIATLQHIQTTLDDQIRSSYALGEQFQSLQKQIELLQYTVKNYKINIQQIKKTKD